MQNMLPGSEGEYLILVVALLVYMSVHRMTKTALDGSGPNLLG